MEQLHSVVSNNGLSTAINRPSAPFERFVAVGRFVCVRLNDAGQWLHGISIEIGHIANRHLPTIYKSHFLLLQITINEQQVQRVVFVDISPHLLQFAIVHHFATAPPRKQPFALPQQFQLLVPND